MNVAADEKDYAAFLNFLHFGEATLTFPQTLILRYAHFESAERRSPQVAEDYAKWFLARLRTLEPRLEQHDFLAQDRFTAADISVGYALLLAQHLGLSTQFTPAVARYSERLRLRDDFQRALAAQEGAALAQGISTVPAPDVRPASQDNASVRLLRIRQRRRPGHQGLAVGAEIVQPALDDRH